MLTYWEILTEIQSNAPVNDIYAQLWGKKLSNTYTVLTYTGTLPATLAGTEAGYLKSYTIYGNTENGESVGERTESGEPTGYKLPMVVGKNLYNAKNDTQGYYINVEGAIAKWFSYANYISDKIPVSPGKKYILYYPLTIAGQALSCAFYNASGTQLSITRLDSTTPPYEKVYNLVAPANAAYFQTSIKREPDSEPKTLFVEHTYDVPIYIGSDPLAEDEYVSYGEQKVYRMVSGTLTPTDPPTPIPALPTIDGETIINWAGSGLAPSEVELIYKAKR